MHLVDYKGFALNNLKETGKHPLKKALPFPLQLAGYLYAKMNELDADQADFGSVAAAGRPRFPLNSAAARTGQGAILVRRPHREGRMGGAQPKELAPGFENFACEARQECRNKILLTWCPVFFFWILVPVP